jgi:hypothetical protein
MNAPSRTIWSLAVLHLQQLDVGHVETELGVGLHVHLPGPAVTVEVVDVVGAEIDLQSIENVAHLHAQGHALGAVDFQVEPGRVRPGAAEHALQAVRVSAAGHDLVAHGLQAVEAEVSAILDDQLEAARGAQAVDGRSAKGRHHGGPHFRMAALLDCLGDGVGPQ